VTHNPAGFPTERLAADEAGIARASELLRQGACVAFPTETVYGLGADATNGRAVAGIYEAKGRPSFNPLIAHVPDLAAARQQGEFNEAALRLAKAFWPGPLTLVVPLAATSDVSSLMTAGLDSIGLRIPDHPVAAKLLRAVGRPVAAPSANRSGRVSPTTAAHVLADLDGLIAAIVDGGATQVGVESTIVDCRDRPALLRPGGIAREAIERVLGHPLAQAADSGSAPVAPGLLASHYAPDAAVRLEVEAVRPGEAVLLFGRAMPTGIEAAGAVENLSPEGDLAEAASNLFAALRRLDASGAASIGVAPIPAVGLGEAIVDRLRRAAAPRQAAFNPASRTSPDR
jgi:L-threonylcarbamoyladenylate synthase